MSRQRHPADTPHRLARRLALEPLEARALLSADGWAGYARDAQHTAQSAYASQALRGIAWQTPVDLSPQFSGEDLLIHYGSPLITAQNTIVLPVKTGASGGFKVEGINAATGQFKWTQTTDYVLPPHNWVPSYAPTLTPSGRLYFAGAGGTVYYIDSPDSTGAATTGQIAFYGLDKYQASAATFNSRVFIDTPLTSDSSGNIYFGFVVTGSNPAGLKSGIARIDAAGHATWIAASAAAGDSQIQQVVMNAAPAVSNDGKMLYVAVSEGDFNGGYLVALDSATLQPIGNGVHVRLKDPNGRDAILPDDGSASPTVGPDGDVYFGVLENSLGYNHDRGWLLHFSGDLTKSYAPGAFGWDDTASIVPSTMIPGYSGSATYLLMTKYNNYAGGGGDGINKLAIVDPQATMIDPVTHATVMKEVLTIAGVTPDDEFPAIPNAVREWCINSAVVDPQTDSVLANSEDGRLYRWNLATNSFTQSITLTAGVGEAYTPTVIGVDGTVYAINDATLFAVRGTRIRFDVNGDGQVAPKDLVVLIAYLNGYGASPAPPPGDTGPYLDVNGDGLVAPNDILQVISYLNGISTGEGEGQATTSSTSVLHDDVAATDDLLGLLASDIAPRAKLTLS
jgi:dockerin type I repeat protein